MVTQFCCPCTDSISEHTEVTIWKTLEAEAACCSCQYKKQTKRYEVNDPPMEVNHSRSNVFRSLKKYACCCSLGGSSILLNFWQTAICHKVLLVWHYHHYHQCFKSKISCSPILDSVCVRTSTRFITDYSAFSPHHHLSGRSFCQMCLRCWCNLQERWHFQHRPYFAC
jgi:hypothetical protein